MPSKSKKQHNFMAAIANSKDFAKKADVPMSVGKEFMKADEGKKFRKGGSTNPTVQGINKQKTNRGSMQLPNAMLNKYVGHKEGGMATMKKDMSQDKKLVKKAVGMHDKQLHAGKKTNLATLKKGGSACAPKKMASGGLAAGHKAADGIATKGKTKARKVTMKKGGYC
jgi:hypothetical protein